MYIHTRDHLIVQPIQTKDISFILRHVIIVALSICGRSENMFYFRCAHYFYNLFLLIFQLYATWQDQSGHLCCKLFPRLPHSSSGNLFCSILGFLMSNCLILVLLELRSSKIATCVFSYMHLFLIIRIFRFGERLMIS